MTKSTNTSSKSPNSTIEWGGKSVDTSAEIEVAAPKVKRVKKAAVTPAKVSTLPKKETHYDGSKATDKRPIAKTSSKPRKQTVEVPAPRYAEGLKWTNVRTGDEYEVGVDVPQLVWADVQRVLLTLVEDGVMGAIVPTADPWADALAMRAYTREDWEDILPLIATTFIECLETGEIPNSTRNQVRLWLVWWWLHKTSGWQRPPVQKQLLSKPTEIKVFAPEYECPACKMKWRDDKIQSLDKELVAYTKWLSVHAKVHAPAKPVRARKLKGDYIDIPKGHTENVRVLDLGLDTQENAHELTISDRAEIARRRLQEKMEAHTRLLQERKEVPVPPKKVYTAKNTLLYPNPSAETPKKKGVRKKKVTTPK